MKQSNAQALTLELKHNGERLTLRRVKTDNGVEELHLTGSLPAHQGGPPPHIHFEEDGRGEVVSGTLSALVDGKHLVIKAGDSGHFPKGSAHRWWNDGDEELVMRGVVTPAIDLDLYLQALFEVINAGPPNRPPIFYMAHVLYRHRKTQLAAGRSACGATNIIPNRRAAWDRAWQISRDCLAGMPKPVLRYTFRIAGVCKNVPSG